jgi:hypothetical protein
LGTHHHLTPPVHTGGGRTAHPASHVVPIAESDATSQPDVVPSRVDVQLPAHPGYVHCVGDVLHATLVLIGRDLAAEFDLEMAARVLVDATIQHARPWTPLQVSIAVDDTDVFVRLAVHLLDPDRTLQLGSHVQAVLRRHVESYEVLQEGDTAFAVLQAPLEPGTA